MSYQVFHWISLMAIIFSSFMIVIRFAFYSSQEQARSKVYFWGGCLFLMLGLSDVSSNLFFGTVPHGLQNTVFFGLTLWAMLLAARNRRLLKVKVS